jgi:ribosomal protein L37AE/L43A
MNNMKQIKLKEKRRCPDCGSKDTRATQSKLLRCRACGYVEEKK